MPVIAAIEGRILHTVFSDPFTFDDFVRAYLSAMKSPTFTPPMQSLIDVSRVVRSVPSNEIEAMVEFAVQHKDKFPGRAAIVCNPCTLVYALARMFCAMAECRDLEYTIFNNLHDAHRWVAQTGMATRREDGARF